MKSKRLTILLLFLFCCISIASCKQWEDLSLLQNNNCLPPCWNGITPGQTRNGEVNIVLENTTEIEVNSIKKGTASHQFFPDFISWNYKNGSFGNIFFKDNIVVEIDFGNVNYRLSDIYQLYGEPDEVVLFPYNGKEWKVNILYREKGIWLYYTKKVSDWKINIKPNDTVKKVSYLNEEYFLTILSNSGSVFLRDEEMNIEEVVQPWTQFGDFSIVRRK